MNPMTIVVAEPRSRLTGEVRRRQIVEIVLDLVGECGADNVSVQAIADRIGLTQPAVFRHFPNKEAIWISVMEWLEERLGRIHRAAEKDAGESALTILKRIFLDHVRMIQPHPALAKVGVSDRLRL